jgi:phage terminase small subunit
MRKCKERNSGNIFYYEIDDSNLNNNFKVHINEHTTLSMYCVLFDMYYIDIHKFRKNVINNLINE